MKEKTGFDRAEIALLTASHMVIDHYNGYLAPLLPLFIVQFNFSLTWAGVLSTVFFLSHALGQPLFGVLSDRLRRRVFIVLGPVLGGLFMSFLGFSGSYWSLMGLLIAAGISSASYHPQATAWVGNLTSESRGLGISVFLAGGRVGFALGPIVAAGLVVRWGLEGLLLSSLPALAIGLLLWVQRPSTRPLLVSRQLRDVWAPLWKRKGPLALLWVLEVIRTATMMGLSAFLPLLFTERGYSLMAAGASVTVFLAAGAVGLLVGGYASDRLGRRSVILLGTIFALPLLYAFLHTGGVWTWVFLALGGFCLLATLATTVAQAQELVPEVTGTVSSLMMGVAWSVGALGNTGIGYLGDRLGLGTAFDLFLLGLLAAIACALRLPRDAPARAALVREAPAPAARS